MYYVLLFCFFPTSGPTNSTNSTVIAGSNIVYSIGVAGFSLILLLLLLLVVVVVLLLVLLCYKALKEKISEALEGQWTYLNTSSKIPAHTETLTCIITLLI